MLKHKWIGAAERPLHFSTYMNCPEEEYSLILFDRVHTSRLKPGELGSISAVGKSAISFAPYNFHLSITWTASKRKKI